MTDVATTYGQALYDLARDEGLSQSLLAEQVLRKTLVPGQVIHRLAVSGGNICHSASPKSLMN